MKILPAFCCLVLQYLSTNWFHSYTQIESILFHHYYAFTNSFLFTYSFTLFSPFIAYLLLTWHFNNQLQIYHYHIQFCSHLLIDNCAHKICLLSCSPSWKQTCQNIFLITDTKLFSHSSTQDSLINMYKMSYYNDMNMWIRMN